MVCVLIVEDDTLLRNMTARLLEHSGYSAVVAGSAAQALAVATARTDINVALIDMVLPDMSGLDLAAEIRRLAPAVSIAFMSGFTGDHFKRPVSEPCVTKPFTLEALTRAVEDALGHRPPT